MSVNRVVEESCGIEDILYGVASISLVCLKKIDILKGDFLTPLETLHGVNLLSLMRLQDSDMALSTQLMFGASTVYRYGVYILADCVINNGELDREAIAKAVTTTAINILINRVARRLEHLELNQ